MPKPTGFREMSRKEAVQAYRDGRMTIRQCTEVVSESACTNAVKMRIQAYDNLKGIIEQGIEAFGDDDSGCRELQKMLGWVKMLADSHEELLREWKARGNK